MAADHHEKASPAVAQVIFDGMSPADQEEVRKEAEAKGVDVLDIVRSSLDVLIAEAGPAQAKR